MAVKFPNINSIPFGNNMINNLVTIAIAAFFTSTAANAQQKLNCDSTCLVPNPAMQTPINKLHAYSASTLMAPGVVTFSGMCGPSANSILPGAPDSFLCSAGNASVVSTVGNKYYWSCAGTSGAPANCNADQRIVGSCGASDGTTVSSSPTSLCTDGSSSGLTLTGSTYTWSCTGNYGAPASCSAILDPAPISIPLENNNGFPIYGCEDTANWIATSPTTGKWILTLNFNGKGNIAAGTYVRSITQNWIYTNGSWAKNGASTYTHIFVRSPLPAMQCY